MTEPVVYLAGEGKDQVSETGIICGHLWKAEEPFLASSYCKLSELGLMIFHKTERCGTQKIGGI